MAHFCHSYWRLIDFHLAWTDTFPRSPDVTVTDDANALTSDASHTDANPLQLETKALLVEATFTINIVERYHELLCRSYRTIRKDAKNMEPENALQAVVRSVNDSVGLGGLESTFPIYKEMSRPELASDPFPLIHSITHAPLPNPLHLHHAISLNDKCTMPCTPVTAPM